MKVMNLDRQAWKEQPNKLEQKDTDARWTKKNGISYYGYKNHVDADVKHKVMKHGRVCKMKPLTIEIPE